MAGVDENGIELIYWDIQGLGAPCRMLLEYSGVPWKDTTVSLLGEPGNITGNTWPDLKVTMQEKNPMANLPMVINGKTSVAQTISVLMYLQKVALPTISVEQEVLCHQVVCEAHDLRNEGMKQWYGPPFGLLTAEDYAAKGMDMWKAHFDGPCKTVFTKFENTLKMTGGLYAGGDTPCAGDFHMWVMMEVHTAMAKDFGFPAPLQDFACASKMYEAMKKEPKLQKYFANQHKLPPNNKIANWGARPLN